MVALSASVPSQPREKHPGFEPIRCERKVRMGQEEEDPSHDCHSQEVYCYNGNAWLREEVCQGPGGHFAKAISKRHDTGYWNTISNTVTKNNGSGSAGVEDSVSLMAT